MSCPVDPADGWLKELKPSFAKASLFPAASGQSGEGMSQGECAVLGDSAGFLAADSMEM